MRMALNTRQSGCITQKPFHNTYLEPLKIANELKWVRK